jgi:hypothetical protein
MMLLITTGLTGLSEKSTLTLDIFLLSQVLRQHIQKWYDCH